MSFLLEVDGDLVGDFYELEAAKEAASRHFRAARSIRITHFWRDGLRPGFTVHYLDTARRVWAEHEADSHSRL
jgi:hypothetical protein